MKLNEDYSVFIYINSVDQHIIDYYDQCHIEVPPLSKQISSIANKTLQNYNATLHKAQALRLRSLAVARSAKLKYKTKSHPHWQRIAMVNAAMRLLIKIDALVQRIVTVTK